MSNSAQGLEKIIANYIEYRHLSLHWGRKKTDAEKEYNRLLTKYSGEVKQYTLEQADRIYTCYLDMITFSEESKIAEMRFFEAEEKLKEIGRILFDATITAEITTPAVNGFPAGPRVVTVAYDNGQVIVSPIH